MPDLLRDVIDSFEKLETAMYLVRERGAARSTAEIAAATGLPTDEVVEAVRALDADGIVREAGGRWSLVADGPRAADVTDLFGRYERDRVEVVRLMGTLAVERIRSRAARLFADAFVVRAPKKKGEDDG